MSKSGNQDTDFAKSEFETLWKEAEGCDILPIDAKKVKGGTSLAGDITPYELYMKLLNCPNSTFFGHAKRFSKTGNYSTNS